MNKTTPKIVKRLPSEGYEPPYNLNDFDDEVSIGMLGEDFRGNNFSNSFSYEHQTEVVTQKFCWKDWTLRAILSRLAIRIRNRRHQKELENLTNIMTSDSAKESEEFRGMLKKQKERSESRRKTTYADEREPARLAEIDRISLLQRSKMVPKTRQEALNILIEECKPDEPDGLGIRILQHYQKKSKCNMSKYNPLGFDSYLGEDTLKEQTLELPEVSDNPQADFICRWIHSDWIQRSEELSKLAKENPLEYSDLVDIDVLRQKLTEQQLELKQSLVMLWKEIRQKFSRHAYC